jgi:hypothetical protein
MNSPDHLIGVNEAEAVRIIAFEKSDAMKSFGRPPSIEGNVSSEPMHEQNMHESKCCLRNTWAIVPHIDVKYFDDPGIPIRVSVLVILV